MTKEDFEEMWGHEPPEHVFGIPEDSPLRIILGNFLFWFVFLGSSLLFFVGAITVAGWLF